MSSSGDDCSYDCIDDNDFERETEQVPVLVDESSDESAADVEENSQQSSSTSGIIVEDVDDDDSVISVPELILRNSNHTDAAQANSDSDNEDNDSITSVPELIALDNVFDESNELTENDVNNVALLAEALNADVTRLILEGSPVILGFLNSNIQMQQQQQQHGDYQEVSDDDEDDYDPNYPGGEDVEEYDPNYSGNRGETSDLYYCYRCNYRGCDFMADVSDGEIHCSSCNGTFVERIGQPESSLFIPHAIDDDDNDDDDDDYDSSHMSLPPVASPSDSGSDDEVGREFAPTNGFRTSTNRDATRAASYPPHNDNNQQRRGSRQRPVSVLHGSDVRPQGNLDQEGFAGIIRSMLSGVGNNVVFGNGPFNMGGNVDLNMESMLHHILMHETSHYGVPPASGEQLGNLRRSVVEASADLVDLGECCISLEQFQVGDVLVELPCGHRFREPAIVEWLQRHNSCPVCRLSV